MNIWPQAMFSSVADFTVLASLGENLRDLKQLFYLTLELRRYRQPCGLFM